MSVMQSFPYFYKGRIQKSENFHTKSCPILIRETGVVEPTRTVPCVQRKRKWSCFECDRSIHLFQLRNLDKRIGSLRFQWFEFSWSSISPFCLILGVDLKTCPIQLLKDGTCGAWLYDHFSWGFGAQFAFIVFISFHKFAHEKVVFVKMNSCFFGYSFSFYSRVKELVRAVISLVRKVPTDI